MPILVLLLAAGVIELTVLVLVGDAIGVWPTIGLLIAAAGLGSWLLRREGRRTLHEINEAARLRRPLTKEFADGALIAIGGLLVVLPGFVSDVLALVCLLPPTRALLRRRVERSAERRSRDMHDQMRAQVHFGYPSTASRQRESPDGDVIEGEVVSVSDDEAEQAAEQELPPRSGSRYDGSDR